MLFSHWIVSNSFVTPWTVAHQTPLSMGFPRQEYRSGLPFPSPGDLSYLENLSSFGESRGEKKTYFESSKSFIFYVSSRFCLKTELFLFVYRWRVLRRHAQSLGHVRLFATPWTVAHQAPLSMGFPRQEYWSGLPFPSPGDLPDPGIEPRSPALEADTLTS